jgi:hypothetical protein
MRYLLLMLFTFSANAALSPLLVVQQKFTNDWVTANQMKDNYPALYVYVSWYYREYTNTGTVNGFASGIAYQDSNWMCNSNNTQRFLFNFSDVPTNLIATFVPYILNRYTNTAGTCPYAVVPMNELQDFGLTSDTIKIFRSVLGANVRMIGPSYLNNWSPLIYDWLAASNSLSDLDGIDAHDYYCAPNFGASFPPFNDPYVHPWQRADQQYSEGPNLSERLSMLRTNSLLLRTNYPDMPKVWCCEYGLYINDLTDAAYAGDVMRQQQVPTLIWLTAAQRTNSWPYDNGWYDSTNAEPWSDPRPSDAAQVFIDRVQLRPRMIGSTARIIP